ncbi:MAG: carboxypeptidase regulatory-like domain-containing protein, partial [Candidatus Eisenbacteria bacterium]
MRRVAAPPPPQRALGPEEPKEGSDMLLRALVCWCVLSPAWAFAQTSTHAAATGQIVGRVTAADGAPISGVNVIVLGLPIGAPCDEDGWYRLLGVPVGQHEVRAQLLGQASVVQAVTVD